MTRLTGPSAALVAVIALLGCGVKGPPQPPLIRVADPTRDLEVFQDGRSAVLRWSYPSSTTSGEVLYDLEAVQIWRATFAEIEAPPVAENVRERDLNRQLLLANGELVAELDRSALEAATRGAKLEWRDDLVRWRAEHPSDEPQMLWYAVRTVCCKRRQSGLSNIVRLVPVEPPAPPGDLRVVAEAEGIRLSWTPHDELPVIVERSPDGSRWETVTRKPLTTDHWIDRRAPQQQHWSYRLRSVIRATGKPRVVGEPGPPTETFYADIYPPAVPDGLVCLPEGSRVRLRWQGVADALAYRVRRAVEDGAAETLADNLGTPQFEDLAPPPGTSTYEVTAIDAAGNESAPAQCSAARGSVR